MKRLLIVLIVGLTVVLGCGKTDTASIQGKTQTEKITGLIKQLKDKDMSVRLEATKSLEKIKDKSAVQPLIDALRENRPAENTWALVDVSGGAARALGKIGDKSATPALIEALGYGWASIRSNASWALENITGQDFGEDYDKWQEWWEANKDK